MKWINCIIFFILSALPFPATTKENTVMSPPAAQKIIENFYEYFNTSQFEKLFALLDENVEHEINYGGVMKGKKAFEDYMSYSQKHFKEQVDRLLLMISDDGQHVTSKFHVTGIYHHTDDPNLPANGQTYQLTAVNYFVIQNGKIIKAQCWYDESDWLKQIKHYK